MKNCLHVLIKENSLKITEIIDEIRHKYKETYKIEQAIKILKYHNDLDLDQLNNLKEILVEFCNEEDYETVQWIMRKEIKDENGISYKIDTKTKTSSIFSFPNNQKNILVPQNIKYNDTEYVITNIFNFTNEVNDKIENLYFCENSFLINLSYMSFAGFSIEHISIPPTVTTIGEKAFFECVHLKSIEIPVNSKLKFIEKFAFYESLIEYLFVPADFIEFKEYWCIGTKFLKRIIVSPENYNFKFTENNLLLGKSDTKSDNFDVIIFGSREIENIKIPSDIKLIGSGAFSECNKLKNIEITSNSKLEKIEKSAFKNSLIESLFVPSCFCEFESNWCVGVEFLTNIKISPENSNFKFTEDHLLLGKSDSKSDNFDVVHFGSRNIETIKIPSNIKQINASAFNTCQKLKTIEFHYECELNRILKSSFYRSSIEKITIPQKVVEIESFAFYECSNLKIVEFNKDSKLECIGEYAFYGTSIESIHIPSNVTKIGEYAFCECYNLKKIEINKNSELKFIDQYAFSETLIEEIYVPSDVIKIADYTFSECTNLKKVEFANDSKLKFIGEFSFYKTSIEKISIPKNVKNIQNSAFSQCRKLKIIEFNKDSELQFIGKYAFTETSIENIKIPSNVLKIDQYAFGNCKSLKSIEIPTDSNLREIDEGAFYSCLIQSLFIPSHFCEFKNNWCIGTKNLTNIEISSENCKFKFTEDHLLIEKSDLKNDKYDIILFGSRKIETIKIHSNIKIISASAFECCTSLKTISFQPNSELQIIDQNAFCKTNIESISIPPHVTKIEKFAFNFCNNLKTIEIPFDSELKKIGNGSFSDTSIESLYIPSHFCEFENGWCFGTTNLKNILISSENKKYKFINNQVLFEKSDVKIDKYDVIQFVRRDVKNFTIQSNITKIASSAFNRCQKLKTIEFSKNSELKIIDKSAFVDTNIEKIRFPSSLTIIGEKAFCSLKIKIIEIPNDSELQIIDNQAFENSLIKSIYIPSKVIKIGENAFNNCFKLKIIEISEKVILESFNEFVNLSYNSILMIPFRPIVEYD